MTAVWEAACNQLIALHPQAAGINPALEKLYPVAVVEGEQFLIYDLGQTQAAYEFIKKAPTPMPIPVGLRAAFQLEDYGGRIACVVTPDVFESRGGYVTIFHKFVHCYQYETCEQDLKMGLDVARQAQEVGDPMWEIQHPFPYQAESFIQPYTQFLQAAEKADPDRLIQARVALQTYLGVHDFEYMVWQEWKEGFARWVENRLKLLLGIPENLGGRQKPYSRVTFYAGGAAWIEFLSKQDPKIVEDLQALFSQMISTNHLPSFAGFNDEYHP
jgi:hypothetical protein